MPKSSGRGDVPTSLQWLVECCALVADKYNDDDYHNHMWVKERLCFFHYGSLLSILLGLFQRAIFCYIMTRECFSMIIMEGQSFKEVYITGLPEWVLN